MNLLNQNRIKLIRISKRFRYAFDKSAFRHNMKHWKMVLLLLLLLLFDYLFFVNLNEFKFILKKLYFFQIVLNMNRNIGHNLPLLVSITSG